MVTLVVPGTGGRTISWTWRDSRDLLACAGWAAVIFAAGIILTTPDDTPANGWYPLVPFILAAPMPSVFWDTGRNKNPNMVAWTLFAVNAFFSLIALDIYVWVHLLG